VPLCGGLFQQIDVIVNLMRAAAPSGNFAIPLAAPRRPRPP